jgi:hypothetical protein
MAQISVYGRGRDKIIVTGAARGRIVALHGHAKKRIRNKYDNAVVFLRSWVTPATLNVIVPRLQEVQALSRRGWIRFCAACRKHGIDARVEAPRRLTA